ncbi:hypothetical protein MIND_01339600 [Mycena indigotica]|uniref:DUF6534 domain-containing protein n=1 Tax=Mycena indigotica TaxID=2126181 RepID=A0A8H6VVZ6_9AGAR|nr:uncharacterized protein MIND_01339600 [Mycena indigotica]KAF7290259.1 hypothetical protein MIND_01339600 [Mycena indigotica]
MPAFLEDVFAPPLIGTWINSMVYMVELLLAYEYYTNKHLRSPGANTTFVRWIVALQLLIDTVGTIGDSAFAYLMLVTHWGDMAYLAYNAWPGAVYCITSGISGFIVQLYLVWRYGILSKNYVICGILVLGALTAVSGAIGLGILSMVHRSTSDRKKIVPISMVWLIASVVTDIGVAGALVITLRGFKSNFKSTRSIIHRLIVGAIQTGSATAVVAAVTLITFALWPNTALSLAPGFFLGRLYGCTLLFNLTTRRMGGAGDPSDASDEHFSGSRGASGTARDRDRATRLDTFGGIHVHQIVQVNNDDDIRGLDSKLARSAVDDTGDEASVGESKAHIAGVI